MTLSRSAIWLTRKGFDYIKIGRHHGKNRLLKASGLAYRAFQLAPLVLREKPVLGLSHGARSQLLLGNALGIPTVLIEDYEFSRFPIMMRPSWIMAPSVIPDDALPLRNGRIRKYAGIKEDVYVWKFKPDPSFVRGSRSRRIRFAYYGQATGDGGSLSQSGKRKIIRSASWIKRAARNM